MENSDVIRNDDRIASALTRLDDSIRETTVDLLAHSVFHKYLLRHPSWRICRCKKNFVFSRRKIIEVAPVVRRLGHLASLNWNFQWWIRNFDEIWISRKQSDKKNINFVICNFHVPAITPEPFPLCEVPRPALKKSRLRVKYHHSINYLSSTSSEIITRQLSRRFILETWSFYSKIQQNRNMSLNEEVRIISQCVFTYSYLISVVTAVKGAQGPAESGAQRGHRRATGAVQRRDECFIQWRLDQPLVNIIKSFLTFAAPSRHEHASCARDLQSHRHHISQIQGFTIAAARQ